MRNAKRLGMLLVAVFALSAMGASSASAVSLFLASAAGQLEGKALTEQVFTTSAGKVKCKALKLLNTFAVVRSATQHATVDYESCTSIGGLAATVSPVLYRFNANGKVSLLSPTVTITALGCVVTVFGMEELEKVLYTNLHGAISIKGEVTGILSEGTGATCTYKREGNGTYEGVADVWLLNGGTLTWEA